MFPNKRENKKFGNPDKFTLKLPLKTNKQTNESKHRKSFVRAYQLKTINV